MISNHLYCSSELNISHHCVLSHSILSDCLWPHDCNPPGSSVHGDSPGKNTGMGCHALLQGIFLIKLASLMSPVLAGKFFTTSTTSEAHRRISGLAKREESGNTWDLSLLSSASACSLPECTNFSLWEWCCLYSNFWDGGSYNMQFKTPQLWA